MRVLVTGATGFIGRNVALAFRGDPRLTVLSTARSGAVDLADFDLASPEHAARLIAGTSPDAVIHCVGARHGSPELLNESNVATLDNLLVAASGQAAPPRILVMGSAAEYGLPSDPATNIAETANCAPASPYGQAKLEATRLALGSGLPVTVLRLFNVVGGGMRGLLGEVADFLDGKGAPFDWAKEARSLPMIRDFVAVEDVAETCRLVLAAQSAPPILNVCTGIGRSFGAILDEMQALAGRTVGHPPSSPGSDRIVGDPSLCQKALGFLPSADLSRSLRKAVAGREATR